MYRELLHKSPLLVLPLGALMLFLLIFVGACAWIFTRDTKQIRSAAALPLESDEHPEAS